MSSSAISLPARVVVQVVILRSRAHAACRAGRRGANMSEGLRGALNAMLYRTGDQSRDFVVVLATNRPGKCRHMGTMQLAVCLFCVV